MQKKCILVLAQTLKLVQGDGRRLMNLPLTAFAERLVAVARGRLTPPWKGIGKLGICGVATSGLFSCSIKVNLIVIVIFFAM